MLHIEKRKPKSNLAAYRKIGKIPGVVYGHGFDSTPVLVGYDEFSKILAKQGEASLIDIILDAEKFKVLLQDYQIDPIRQSFTHIDLYRIRMDEKIHTKIPLSFIGESFAVKGGAVLVKNRDYIEVECLPGDLISYIDVELSLLVEANNAIKVSDLSIPKSIHILLSTDEIVATVMEAVQEEFEVTREEEKAKIEELGKAAEKSEEEKAKEETKKE